jgi:hypothetical protein
VACDTIRPDSPGQTLEERMTEVDEALARLERYLKTGSVRVNVGPQGAISFAGWKDRSGVTDACAYRTLASGNSWALRQAVARAEATSGRKVNERAIAAGHHSHDGGKSWDKGH